MRAQNGISGSQTLMRGLDVIEAVAGGAVKLEMLCVRLGLTRSTAHRLASSLVERGYLGFAPRAGYRLGPKLLELGHLAQEQGDLIQIARPHLEALSEATGDAVHLGVLDGNRALYLDKLSGRRRVSVLSRVGERQPLSSTGLGKALMLDRPVEYWRARLEEDRLPGTRVDRAAWEARMHEYVAAGSAFDLQENEDQIRCVAAPVRDAAGMIVAAISVSSASQYMDTPRMTALSADVIACARAISRELGWSPCE